MGSVISEINNIIEEPIQQNIKKEEKNIKVVISKINGTWEKIYNSETPLNKIANDFKLDNNMNLIQKNYYIEFYYNNEPIEMNSSPLKSLITEDISIIYITQEIKSISDTESSEEDENISIIGKPFSDPFQIITFEAKSKKFKTLFLDKDKLKKNGFDKFGIDSAYCNGHNNLFISGGTDHATNKTIGLFCSINLKRVIFSNPIKMTPKKNHSMIYIDKKVYIVGGDDVSCLIYNLDNKQIKKWENLNYKRFEPSLIRHNNFLFCFDTSNKYINNSENIFHFEKIEFKESSHWEVVCPEISPMVINSVFSQKFFGIVEDSKDNIIFVGGIYDNDNKENDISENDNTESYFNENELTNLQYNTNTNIIEKSDIEFKNISFGEKTFLPLDNKTYFILPNFNKRSPKIIYFHKYRDIIEINSYHLNSHSKKNINKVKTSQIKPSLSGINFDMPHKPAKKINRNNSLNIINDNKKISKTTELNNESNTINKELKKYFISNNITFNNKNQNQKKDKDKDIKTNHNNNNLNNDIIKINLSLTESNFENENEKETMKSKSDINDNIINNNNINLKFSSKKEKESPQKSIKNEKDKNSNSDSNEDNIKKNNNKSKSNEVHGLDNNSIKEKNSQQSITSKKEEEKFEIDKDNIQKSIKEKNKSNQIIKSNDENNKDDIVNINTKFSNNKEIKQGSKKIIKKIIYVENSDSLIKYHSSIDDRFNNNININNIIQKIIKRKIAPPIKNDRNIKKLIKKINKTDFNKSRNNQNF